MAEWTFLVCQPDGTPICGLPSARSRRLSWSLTDPATFTFETDVDAHEAGQLVELETDVCAYRDATLMFRGRVGATQDSLAAGPAATSWSVVDYSGVLARRIVWPSMTTSWTGVDQALIVKTLLDATQALTDGDLGVDTTGLTATGVTRDYTADPGKPISDVINALSGMINGFDWSVEPDLKVHVWYPQRGTTVSWPAVLGQTVRTLTRTFDPSTYASDLLGLGGDTTTPHTSSRTPRTRGRWESSASWSDVTVQSTLNAHTDGQLVLDDWLPAIAVTIEPARWTPANAWLGDTIDVSAHRGRVQLDTTARIVGVDVDLGDDNTEAVSLTVNRLIPDRGTKFAAISGRVGNLERR